LLRSLVPQVNEISGFKRCTTHCLDPSTPRCLATCSFSASLLWEGPCAHLQLKPRVPVLCLDSHYRVEQRPSCGPQVHPCRLMWRPRRHWATQISTRSVCSITKSIKESTFMESNDGVRKSICIHTGLKGGSHLRHQKAAFLAHQFSSASEIVVLCDNPVTSWRIICSPSPCQLAQGPCLHLNLLERKRRLHKRPRRKMRWGGKPPSSRYR